MNIHKNGIINKGSSHKGVIVITLIYLKSGMLMYAGEVYFQIIYACHITKQML